MNEAVQIVSAPVGANRWWEISLIEGGVTYSHEGTWDLNGGALSLYTSEGELVRTLGPAAWRSIRPTQ